MVEIEIGQMESGKKVHRLVRQLLPGVPLSGIHKMVRTGRVKRNGKKAKADDVVGLGDVIRIYMAEEDYQEVSKQPKKFGGVSSEVDVIFEDDQLLVVNKPIGLLVHGAEGEHKDTLVNRVLAYLYNQGELDQRIFTPSPVNRLDRNTSGIVLFGKTGDSTRLLSDQIAQHQIRKWYLAIVKGRVAQRGELTGRLQRDEERNVTTVGEEGKEALTRFVPIASTGRTSVVKVELVSGRTHQIRAHFSHLGHPLWDDVKYGGRVKDGRQDQHQWLHAGWLEMADGRTFSAPLPPEYVETLRSLGYTDQQILHTQR